MESNFWDLLEDVDGLSAAFKAIEPLLTKRQRNDLCELFLSSDGEPAERHGRSVLKSRTVHSCSRIGSRLTLHFDGVGPSDSMMWIGYVDRQLDDHERWVMRPEVRDALRQLGWFGPGPKSATEVSGFVEDFAERAERFAWVKVRTEQEAFRAAVVQACKGCCVISGNPVSEVLEAAHIEGRRWKDGQNSVNDGILLRRDLHALYDKSLLLIDERGRVTFDERVVEHYREFQGKVIAGFAMKASEA